MAADASILQSSYQLGSLTLPNRVIMAPMTRNRADEETMAPTDLMVEYYRQRASAGLIITEGTQISQQGQGYQQTPGIYSEAQVEGWSKITDAVHEAGGRIFAQLWHVGRVSHITLQPGNNWPVAPSALPAQTKTYVNNGFVTVSAPRALQTEEIPGIVRDFLNAAENAKRAGFDGVELHGANGYLIDQFLHDGTNHRHDAYGGSVENRVRFAVEVTEAVLRVFEPSRVGFRISPASVTNDVRERNPAEVFGYLVKCLDALNIGYVHCNEMTGPDSGDFDFKALRKLFHRTWIANFAYTGERAAEAINSGHADLVAFGKPFLANPDLPARLAKNAPLNTPEQATFYGGTEKGYTDYPALAVA
jgi:N-ethylmaleimide reductase